MVASLVMSADAQFTVLQLSDHGNARREDHLYGGWHRRFLNATGRWSAVGTKEVPLIAWPDEGTAAQAANIASQARGRDVYPSGQVIWKPGLKAEGSCAPNLVDGWT